MIIEVDIWVLDWVVGEVFVVFVVMIVVILKFYKFVGLEGWCWLYCVGMMWFNFGV